jgi:type II secretory pathway component PulK
MALMVLVVAGVMLAAMARQSCQEALLAGAAREQLQARWGSRGLQAAILPQAQDIFLTRQDSGVVSPRIDARFDLGGMSFQVVLSDEQAKLEVNTFYRANGQQGLMTALQTLQQDMAKPLGIALTPSPSITSRPASTAPASEQLEFTCFDQLLRFDSPRQLLGSGTKEGVAGRITCWSSGLVNFVRADAPVLKIKLAGALDDDQIARILQYRQRHPDVTYDDIVKELALTPAKAQEVRALLTDQSAGYSLWVVAHSPTRDYYRLYVLASQEDGVRELRSYAW